MVENNFSEEHLCGKYLDIYPSMIGSLCPIKSVPDEVFANELLGQGFAIDPFEGKLYAPCDGVIVSIHKAKHAITILNQNNVRLLIHIGIDSVILNGSGFNLHIVESQKVSRSELLATFDLDFIASKAKSIVTPHILIDNQHKIEYLTNLDYTTTNLDFPILRVHISNNHYLKANNLDSINNLNNQTATKNYDLSGLIKSPAINIANKSGIHARPAALLSKFANQLKSINVDDLIIIEKNGQLANLKSMMSVLLLSINYKDTVFIYSSSDEINQLFIAKINDIANTHENQTTIDEINKQQNSTLDKPCQDIQIMETINLSNDVHNNNQNKFYGIFASGGVAVGKLHVLEDDKQILSEAILDNILSNLASYTKTNYEFELNYYNQVLNAVKLDIQNKINNINNIYPNTYDINLNLDRAQSSNVSSAILLDDSHAKLRLELLNAHLNLLLDYDINHDIKELIVKDNKNALFAVVFIYDKYRKSLQNLDNILIKERSNDLYDVLQQLYTKFNNQISIEPQYTTPTILLKYELSPNDIINYNKNIVGLVTVKGGLTSHITLLAKSYKIPLLIGVSDLVFNTIKNNLANGSLNRDSTVSISYDFITENNQNNQIIAKNLDLGFLNLQTTNFDYQQITAYQEQELLNNNKLITTFKEDAITLDKYKIFCYANISTINDLSIANLNGSDGIGLCRTELLFNSHIKPTLSEQINTYTNLFIENFKVSNNKNFVIRLFDPSYDKPLKYFMNIPADSLLNPVLGTRGIRLLLANKLILQEQLRSIVSIPISLMNRNWRPDTNNVNLEYNIKILIPMLTSINEYTIVREMLDVLINELLDERLDGALTHQKLKNIFKFKLGVMIETPASIFVAKLLAPLVDFFSVGSNDLTQYILSSDRDITKYVDTPSSNDCIKQIDYNFTYYNPAILHALKMLMDEAKLHHKPVSLCGQIASDSLIIPLLIGLGISELSMEVNAIGSNKNFIKTLSHAACLQDFTHCASLMTGQAVYEYLKSKYYG